MEDRRKRFTSLESPFRRYVKQLVEGRGGKEDIREDASTEADDAERNRLRGFPKGKAEGLSSLPAAEGGLRERRSPLRAL